MASDRISEKLHNMAVGFIGAGRMAQAMAKGFISSGIYFLYFFALTGSFWIDECTCTQSIKKHEAA